MRFARIALSATALAFVATSVTDALAGTVYVGDYTSKEVRRFDEATGKEIGPNPWISGVTTEGIACLMGVPGVNPNLAFVANPGNGHIELVDTSKDTNAVINANFITGLSGVANIKLSNDGHILYVAQESGNKISEYDSLTGTLIKSVAFTGAHDLLIGLCNRVWKHAASEPGSCEVRR